MIVLHKGKKYISLLKMSILFLCTGCQCFSPYFLPDTDTPEKWKSPVYRALSAEDQETLVESWWTVFKDPILDDLEAQALAANPSLKISMEHVKQAHALAQYQHGLRFPSIFFGPSFNKSGALLQNPLRNEFSSDDEQHDKKGHIPDSFRFVDASYALPFQFSYEFDLFNRLKNGAAAAFYRAEAAEAAFQNVFLQLTANVAATYFRMKGLASQIAVFQRNICLRQEFLDIVQKRYRAGLAIYIDVTRAEEELSIVKVQYTGTQELYALEENILSVLLGKPAPTFNVYVSPLANEPPAICPCIPSELLHRRADIAAAELELAAAHADLGVAYSSYFPSINLTAQLGLQSPFIGSLLTWKARLWDFGISVVQSVFTAGRNDANVDYFIAKYQEALAVYEERVLVAFKDVEDALINLRYIKEQEMEIQAALEASQETLSLSKSLYEKGLLPYLDVIASERNFLQNQIRLTEIHQRDFLSTILLIRALGGSWSSCKAA